MAARTPDVTCVRYLLEELHKSISSSSLLCNNQSAINITFNLILHCRTKHIKINQYFIHQKVKDKETEPAYVHSNVQIANVFTKELPTHQFQSLKNKLCMI